MRFKKGDPKPEGSGRQAGTPNKVSTDAKVCIEGVAERLGGIEGLYKWAASSPAREDLFWTKLFVRLLPRDLNLAGDVHPVFSIAERLEDARKRMERARLEELENPPVVSIITGVPLSPDQIEREKQDLREKLGEGHEREQQPPNGSA